MTTISSKIIFPLDAMLAILFPYIVFTFFALPSIASPLDLATLQIINSTNDFDTGFPYTSAIHTMDNVESLVGCFQQSPPQDPQLFRTNFLDCFNVQEQLAAHDPHRPIHFHRNNDTEFELPNRFSYRTCTVLLDMVSADAEDTFNVADIRAVTIDTARKCTAGRKSLGGKAMVGPRQLMEVWITGRP